MYNTTTFSIILVAPNTDRDKQHYKNIKVTTFGMYKDHITVTTLLEALRTHKVHHLPVFCDQRNGISESLPAYVQV